MEPILRTLFVHTAGTRLILEGNAVKALRDDLPPRRLPLEAIDTIVVTTGVDVSTPLLVKCAEDGRVVAFVSSHGRPRALVEGAAVGRADLRRRQYAAHADPVRRSLMAGAIVAGKLRQMAWASRQWARDADTKDQSQLRGIASELDARAIGCLSREMTRDGLLGIEGEATRRYFTGMGLMLGADSWPGRRRRPVRDPVNGLLSWVYGLSRVAVQGALMVAGLDAGTGFLHGDRAGQPSLALDLLEEFRPSADRFVVKMWRTGRIQQKDFDKGLTGVVELRPEARDVLFDAWHRHRADEVLVGGRVGAVTNGFVPIIQAHAMANAIRRGTPYEAHRRRVR